MKTLRQARINYKRAETVNDREQARGAHDLSVKQTRRMALAVKALQRAAFDLRDAERRVRGEV